MICVYCEKPIRWWQLRRRGAITVSHWHCRIKPQLATPTSVALQKPKPVSLDEILNDGWYKPKDLKTERKKKNYVV